MNSAHAASPSEYPSDGLGLTAACGTPAARQGRKLDSSRAAAILAATLELVAEVGYERVTMDAIAARCHASKATMYRRWSGKASIVVEAVRARKMHEPLMPETGNLREDLLNGLHSMMQCMSAGDLELVGGLLTASRSDPELAQLLRAQMMSDKQEAAGRWVEGAIARGVLAPGADTTVLSEVVPSLVLSRLLLTGQPVDDDFLNYLVDSVAIPLLTRTAAVSP